MAKKRRLDYIIGADVTEFESKVNTVTRKIDRMGRKAQRFGATWTKALTVPLVAAGSAMLKTASDAEETDSKFKAVFKNQSREVEAWAKTFSRSVGRSTTENKKFLATIQDTLVPLGFARDNAADMSKQVVSLATDLASFNNLNTEQVIADIQSAIVGNTETLRKYGVVAQQSQIVQEALNSGLIKNKSELDANTKAQAILQLALKGTVDAQGDAVRTADGLANSSKGLSSDIKDLAEKFGALMIPTAKEWVGVGREVVQGLTDMDTETQQAIIKWGALTAAGAPLILMIGRLTSGFATYGRNIYKGYLNLQEFIAFHPGLSAMVITIGLLAKSMWDFYHASEKTKNEIRSVMSATGVKGISESARNAAKQSSLPSTADGWIPPAYSRNPLDTKGSRDYGMGGAVDITGLSFWSPEKAKDKTKEVTQAALDEAREYAKKMSDIQSDLNIELLRLHGDYESAELAELKGQYDQLMEEAKNSAETRVKIEEWYAAKVAELNRQAAMDRLAQENEIQMAFATWGSRYGAGSGMSIQDWTSYKKGENDYDAMMEAKKAGEEVAATLGKVNKEQDELATKGDLWANSLSDGLANAIVNAEDLGDALENILQQIGSSILSSIISKSISGFLPFASGGWIPEPVVGFGASGRMYSFAEAGPEYVNRSGAGVGSGKQIQQQSTQVTTVNLHVNAIDSKDAMDFFTKNKGQVTRIIKENIQFNGAIRTAIQGAR
jgi:hypothetical protein